MRKCVLAMERIRTYAVGTPSHALEPLGHEMVKTTQLRLQAKSAWGPFVKHLIRLQWKPRERLEDLVESQVATLLPCDGVMLEGVAWE